LHGAEPISAYTAPKQKAEMMDAQDIDAAPILQSGAIVEPPAEG